jgi:signal peptidase I
MDIIVGDPSETKVSPGGSPPPPAPPRHRKPKYKRKFFDPRYVSRERRGTIILACILFWSVISFHLTSRYILGAGQVVGTSMEPTLRDGDRYIINKWIYRVRAPQRGDVVVVKEPGSEELDVKRIIALPGESLAIREAGVFIGEEKLAEPYLAEDTETDPGGIPGGRYRVAPGCYFVAGDHREVSLDSRYYGAVPSSSLVGFIGRPGL